MNESQFFLARRDDVMNTRRGADVDENMWLSAVGRGYEVIRGRIGLG